MTDLFDPITGVARRVSDEDAEQLFLSGKYGIDPKNPPVLVAPDDGSKYKLPADKVQEALEAGWKFESSVDKTKRLYKEELGKAGILDKIDRALGTASRSLVNQATLGVVGAGTTVLDKNQEYDPKTGQLTALGKWNVENEVNPVSSFTGGTVGNVLSLAYGGPVFRGAELAGGGLVKAGLSRMSPKLAESVVGRVAEKAGAGAAVGAVASAPAAITEAALGEPEIAAETLIGGAAFGSIFGGGLQAAKSPISLALQGVRKISSGAVSEGLRSGAEIMGIKAVGGLASEMNAATNIERIVTGNPKLPAKEARKNFSSFIYDTLGVSKLTPRQWAPEKLVQKLDDYNKALNEERLGYAKEIDKQNKDGLIDYFEVKKILGDIKKEYSGNVANMTGESKTIADSLEAMVDGFAQKVNKEQATTLPKNTVDYARRMKGETVVPDTMSSKQFEAYALENGSPKLTLQESEQVKDGLKKILYPDGSPANNAAADIYSSFLKLQEAAANAGTKGGKLGTQYIKTGKDLQRLILYRPKIEGMANRNASNRVISPFDIIAGAAAQSPAIGAASFVGRQYGARAGEATLLGAAKIIDKFGNQAQSAIDRSLGLASKTLDTGSKYVPRSTQILDSLFDENDSKKDKLEKLNQLSSDLAALTADPETSASITSAFTEDLANLGNEIPSFYQQKLSNAFAYLQDAIPKAPTTSTPFQSSAYVPTDREISRFERKLQAVVEPASVLEDIAQGTATKDQIDAIKTVYPEMFNKLRTMVFERLSTPGIKVPYQQRLRIASLLDEDGAISVDPGAVKTLQANFAPTENAKPKANSKITEASRQGTDIDRVLAGR